MCFHSVLCLIETNCEKSQVLLALALAVKATVVGAVVTFNRDLSHYFRYGGTWHRRQLDSE